MLAENENNRSYTSLIIHPSYPYKALSGRLTPNTDNKVFHLF